MGIQLEKEHTYMSTGDSKAQQEHVRENKQLEKKVKDEGKENRIVIDKKLEGPNRPSE
jgi:hypothetical protein